MSTRYRIIMYERKNTTELAGTVNVPRLILLLMCFHLQVLQTQLSLVKQQPNDQGGERHCPTTRFPAVLVGRYVYHLETVIGVSDRLCPDVGSARPLA